MNLQTLTLQPGSAIALDTASGTRLVCVDGLLWLTQDGAVEDLVLGASQSWTARRTGRIVVQALRTGGTCALEPAARPARLARLAARLRAWAGRFVATRATPA